ncbi:hypothetical protein J2790_003972 [Paenarthrobacter nicotinovorans]|uniref:hypothetical protein n=1 Tax=Micrococcaceae TaxID=1268 RepID=UPI000876EA32|nr:MULTISPECIES: hypothetical protein [Micrococcaceae]MDR6438805.1 hypothetical protein [Paenarthrobacter nicotinovorans]SCZ56251.1 hypothetical protein SAMN02799638_01766 [Arthrobacter sp. UNCCL28]
MNRLTAPIMIAAVLLLGSLSACADSAGPGSGRTSKPSDPHSTNDAYANIPANEIQTAGTDVDFMWEPKDPFYGFNKYPIVARVHIESIGAGRTFSPIDNQHVFPQTVGKMTVREVYKGDIAAGAGVNYSRVGGTVTFDEYWNSLNNAQQEKILRLNGGAKPADAKYIKAKITNDVDLEAGKEYVALLTPRSGQDGRLSEYSVQGYQYGLREVKGTGAETTLLNNETHEWESLGSFVKLP